MTDPSRSGYACMTVNERLYSAGLLNEFDEAAKRRDREGMIGILQIVMDLEQATQTTDTILANPSHYGY